MKTAFIGLGVMGFPMAGHLQAAGHAVTVFNRSPDKAARWVERHGGASRPTIAEAVTGAQLVCLCVGNDDDVRDVVAQALPAMGEGGVIVDHTTTSATVAREMDAAARAVGRWFVDAPVSGGQAGAENGQLTIMAGGDPAAYARVEPVLAAYAKAIRLLGPSGAGQLTKMCNQIAIAGVVQGVAEALHFAKRAGLPTDDVLAAISKGAAQSWQMENRWKTMSEGKFDFGFAVDWMRKDLGIALAEAAVNGANLQATALIDGFYGEVQGMGGHRWDTSSLVARLETPKS
ncbi:NAD(P)-dependent oxidoreductase [Caulobacter rhizosphaerae]|jgi:3-hydroxyisobutyrate dehydrogenase|uniref:NAD(P)-dependent oxidoreductase n=1 Tax=Caulobacter rhizosphaerae TaxID=2010972 RepID=UPI0013D4D639|nr:NAD(P)-dependent oxidoreductase [Caulobacter rhizosphaerae]GGL24959.1 3-hydroxyisobutyrate dehydrogenase [Caulobacter rhizosphaerae]